MAGIQTTQPAFVAPSMEKEGALPLDKAIFVKNLHPAFDINGVRLCFQTIGPIQEVYELNQDLNGGRRFCVFFTNRFDVERAMALNNTELHGYKMDLTPATQMNQEDISKVTSLYNPNTYNAPEVSPPTMMTEKLETAKQEVKEAEHEAVGIIERLRLKFAEWLESVRQSAYAAGHAVSETAGTATHAVAESASRAGHAVMDTATQMKEGVAARLPEKEAVQAKLSQLSQAAHSAQDTASAAGHAVYEKAGQLKDTVAAQLPEKEVVKEKLAQAGQVISDTATEASRRAYEAVESAKRQAMDAKEKAEYEAMKVAARPVISENINFKLQKGFGPYWPSNSLWYQGNETLFRKEIRTVWKPIGSIKPEPGLAGQPASQSVPVIKSRETVPGIVESAIPPSSSAAISAPTGTVGEIPVSVVDVSGEGLSKLDKPEDLGSASSSQQP